MNYKNTQTWQEFNLKFASQRQYLILLSTSDALKPIKFQKTFQ